MRGDVWNFGGVGAGVDLIVGVAEAGGVDADEDLVCGVGGDGDGGGELVGSVYLVGFWVRSDELVGEDEA